MTQRKIWGLQRTYDITENMLIAAGGKVIYGYPCPANPHIIQGYVVDYSRYSAEPYIEDIEAAKTQKGLLMTLDCEGYGDSVEEALHMADLWMYREESRLEVEEIIEKAYPDYTYRIAPSEHSKLKKLNEEENYNTRQSIISAAVGEKFKERLDQFFYKLLDSVETTMNSKQINQQFQHLLEEQKRERHENYCMTICIQMRSDNCCSKNWHRKQNGHGRNIQSLKKDPSGSSAKIRIGETKLIKRTMQPKACFSGLNKNLRILLFQRAFKAINL